MDAYKSRICDKILAAELQGAGAVVIEGAGDLNGVAVRKGDRLVFADERELKLTGKAEVVVCA